MLSGTGEFHFRPSDAVGTPVSYTHLSAFRPGLVVADAVYNPEETRLLREAKEAGCTCLNGKGMLLWQGVAAFRLYTGEEMPVQEVKEKFFQ